jgi:hypothetical protein
MIAGQSQRVIRLETEAIVIGYAMSRLDKTFLESVGVRSWKAAFALASKSIGVRETSFKNLRDEFDPIHSNAREGWWNRPLRTSRQRVALDLAEVSDDALMELVKKILIRDSEATVTAIDALAPERNIAASVAERLLTGRRAEEFFLENARKIVGVETAQLVDCRIMASGYDFATKKTDKRVFEIKGIKRNKGDILFTDREWAEAERRSAKYVLIVVGNLESTPFARVIADPRKHLQATCVWRRSVAATWRSSISIHPESVV